MENFKVLIVPSSDDEKEYPDTLTFEQAVELTTERNDSGQVFEFETEAERTAFCQGVAAMEGWSGEGLTFQN